MIDTVVSVLVLIGCVFVMGALIFRRKDTPPPGPSKAEKEIAVDFDAKRKAESERIDKLEKDDLLAEFQRRPKP